MCLISQACVTLSAPETCRQQLQQRKDSDVDRDRGKKIEKLATTIILGTSWTKPKIFLVLNFFLFLKEGLSNHPCWFAIHLAWPTQIKLASYGLYWSKICLFPSRAEDAQNSASGEGPAPPPGWGAKPLDRSASQPLCWRPWRCSALPMPGFTGQRTRESSAVWSREKHPLYLTPRKHSHLFPPLDSPVELQPIDIENCCSA